MKEVVIRTFEEKDTVSIESILKIIGWTDQYVVGQLECIKKLCHSNAGEVFVAIHKKIIAGFIQVEHHQWNRLSYLHGLVVHPDSRRLGIAKNLVEHVELSSKARKQRGISVDTPVDNLGGRKFYTSIGFNEAYIMPEFYESRLDGVTFQKFFERKFKDSNIKILDTYLALCAEVYCLSKPDAPLDAYPFYREYAKAANGPILEPMCGTGRFLLPLLEEGFDVHGFDASAHMLAKLHEKAKAKNLKANVWHGFAEDLNKSKKYNLIFIPSGSFCLITNQEEVKLVLKLFYNHLTESGILLFEIETVKAVPELGSWRGSIWPKPDGTTIVLSQLTTLDASISKSLGKYELIRDNKITHTEIEEYKIRIYEQDQLVAILKAAGFKHIRILKAFNASQNPNENDESIIYECRK